MYSNAKPRKNGPASVSTSVAMIALTEADHVVGATPPNEASFYCRAVHHARVVISGVCLGASASQWPRECWSCCWDIMILKGGNQ